MMDQSCCVTKGWPRVLRSPGHSQASIGPSSTFYSDIESRYSNFERERVSRDGRERAIDAGRPFTLSLRDRLLMLLMYYRLFISTTLAEFLFGIDQRSICRNMCILESPSSGSASHCRRRSARGRRERAHRRRWRGVLPKIQGLHRCYGAGDTSTKKRQEEEDSLFRQEEETCRKGSADCQLQRLHHYQDQSRQRKETRLRYLQA